MLLDEVDEAVAGRLGAREGAAVFKTLAREDSRPLVAQALVLAEHVADLACADAEIACGHVGVRADVA